MDHGLVMVGIRILKEVMFLSTWVSWLKGGWAFGKEPMWIEATLEKKNGPWELMAIWNGVWELYVDLR